MHGQVRAEEIREGTDQADDSVRPSRRPVVQKDGVLLQVANNEKAVGDTVLPAGDGLEVGGRQRRGILGEECFSQ